MNPATKKFHMETNRALIAQVETFVVKLFFIGIHPFICFDVTDLYRDCFTRYEDECPGHCNVGHNVCLMGVCSKSIKRYYLDRGISKSGVKSKEVSIFEEEKG